MPAPMEAYNDFQEKDEEHPHGRIFYDETFRQQVGALMHLPGMGLKTAYDLRETHSFMTLLGVTEKGLEEAKRTWAQSKGIGKKKIQAWENWIKT